MSGDKPQAADAAHVARTALFRAAIPLTPGIVVSFTYVNWQRHHSERRVQVIGSIWGAIEWHPEPQALLLGLDLDKNEERAFAMRSISCLTGAA